MWVRSELRIVVGDSSVGDVVVQVPLEAGAWIVGGDGGVASEKPNFGSFVLASLFWAGFPISAIPNFSIGNFFEMIESEVASVCELVVGFSFSSQKVGVFLYHKVCGWYSVRFSCSPTSTKLDLHNTTQRSVCCISKSTMKYQQKSNLKSDLLFYSYVIKNVCLLIS